MTKLSQILLDNQSHFCEVIKGIGKSANLLPVDLSKDNQELLQLDLSDSEAFTLWFEKKLDGKIGWGGYMEHREIYRRSSHFNGEDEPRSLHLGIDLWTKADTPVYCPVAGTIYSIQDNAGFGNYGPTVIIEHTVQDQNFFVLYGHLSSNDLPRLSEGDHINAGECFAHLGNVSENGGWPPHLHFQLIANLLGMKGDFPGVAKLSERDKYFEICPDPNIILKCS